MTEQHKNEPEKRMGAKDKADELKAKAKEAQDKASAKEAHGKGVIKETEEKVGEVFGKAEKKIHGIFDKNKD
jgi:hypothetical protein